MRNKEKIIMDRDGKDYRFHVAKKGFEYLIKGKNGTKRKPK